MLLNPDIYVKNWNRMQNAADLGCFYDVKIAHVRFIKIHYVKYWYEICGVSVPLLHAL